MPIRWTALIAAALAAIGLVGLACGDGDGNGDATPGAEEGVVNVRLYEWAVEPSPDSAPAGEVTFVAKNDGAEAHELVIVRTDLAPDALPTAAHDRSVEEAGEGVELIGEIEEFEAGGEESLTVELDAGSYVLFCNLVDEAGEHGETEPHSHYSKGMRAAFTVE